MKQHPDEWIPRHSSEEECLASIMYATWAIAGELHEMNQDDD